MELEFVEINCFLLSLIDIAVGVAMYWYDREYLVLKVFFLILSFEVA